jgi:adenosylcobinamide-phosphate synthase
MRGVLLASTFSGRALLEAAARVEGALVDTRLAHAQHELRWLVSRPTESLDEHPVSAAAIESVAENFVDSWLAPLLAYAAFGVAGAYAY